MTQRLNADDNSMKVQVHDASVAVGTMLLLIRVSALAGLIPAQRASRVNPMLALRYE